MSISARAALSGPAGDGGTPLPALVSFGEALRVWARVAILSFGGPAGQIAVMHRILVEEKRWISEHRFLHALNYCMLLPGPEAQQLATYIGWLLHRTKGGLAAGLLFVLPGFLAILGLSILYALYQDAGIVESIFFGLKPAVMAVVVEAIARIGRRVLKNEVMYAIAALAFIGIFFLGVPFPLIVLGAGVTGFVGGRVREEKFDVIQGHSGGTRVPDEQVSYVTDHLPVHTRPSIGRTLRVAGAWAAIWLVPLVLLMAVFGRKHVLVQEGIFFSQAALVTFGGAYSVLAYIAQQAVEVYGWLQPGEMLDGLGMAETTPGPLIMVVQFVGFLGAFRNPGDLSPLAAGVIGSVVTTWVTFAPCFLWIFAGAPYIEHLRGNRLLSAALSAITAAVVGVILNLALWFALHVVFGTVHEVVAGPVRLLLPVWQSLNVAALLISAGAFIALFRFKLGMLKTMAACVLAGLLTRLVF